MKAMPFLVTAGIISIVRLMVPTLSVTYGGTSYTIGQAHSICTSAIGTAAQAFSTTAVSNCGSVGGIYDALNIITVAGIVFTVIGMYYLVRR
jgi:biotin synthase-like enzyme